MTRRFARSMCRTVLAGALAAGALGLAACGSTESGGTITIGTTDKVVALDPAGSYDNGSLLLESNIYQFLMRVPQGGKTPQPELADKCGFQKPTSYVCTIRSGQKFSNDDPVTAQDVAFSYQRIITINNPNGPASLLANMTSVKATDNKTVVFTLKNGNDQTFPYVLGTSAGPIVDKSVFPADKLLADDKVIGSGSYALSSYKKNQLVGLTANKHYGGTNKPKTDKISLKYYTESNNLKLDVQQGAIDIAWRSLTPTDVEALKKDDGVTVLTGSGGELRYLVFNFKTMPGSNDAQKKAVRTAVAYSVDRTDLAQNVYQGTFSPAYSMVPQGIKNASTPFETAYGAGPDKAKAKAALTKAGITGKVTLNIDYTTDHYGPTSPDEYNQLKRQLEGTGLFTVKLNGTAWTTYSAERVKDSYSIYQLGWFPDFVDADNYLSPFLVEDNFVHAHYCDPKASQRPCDTDKMAALLKTEQTTTGATRSAALAKIQQTLASGELPYLPLLSGKQVAVTHGKVDGVQQTLDPTYQFRMWLFSKS